MKKWKAALAAVMLALVAFLMTACTPNVAGTYKFRSMTFLGTDVVVGQKLLGQEITEDFITITLNQDGTISGSADEDSVSGTWAKSTDEADSDIVYILTLGGADYKVTIQKGILTMNFLAFENVVLQKK